MACSRWARGAWSTSLLPSDWLLCFAWVATFRLADDLADRELDRRRRPDRVLCRTRHERAFHVFLGGLMAMAALATLTLREWKSLVIVVVYGFLLKAWYLGRGKLAASVVCNYHIVLSKYAVITLVLIGSQHRVDWVSASLAAFIAYGLMCVWEVVHDADLRNPDGPANRCRRVPARRPGGAACGLAETGHALNSGAVHVNFERKQAGRRALDGGRAMLLVRRRRMA